MIKSKRSNHMVNVTYRPKLLPIFVEYLLLSLWLHVESGVSEAAGKPPCLSPACIRPRPNICLPCFPLCRSFLSVLLSTPICRPAGEAARRQTAHESKQARKGKGADLKIPLKSLCVAELLHVWVQHRYFNRSLTCSSWSSRCAFLGEVSLWKIESVSYYIFDVLLKNGLVQTYWICYSRCCSC